MTRRDPRPRSDRSPNEARGPSEPSARRAEDAARADPTDLAPEELERLEAGSDPLIDLVGYAERHRPASAAYDDPRFLEWLGKEARERGDDELMTEAEVTRLARRIVVGIDAEQLRVRDVRHVPEEEPWASPPPMSVAVPAAALTRHAVKTDLAIAAGVGRELWDAEVESRIKLPDDIASGPYVALAVAGDSMTPLIHSGDVVLVRLGPEAERDTVVVARDPDGGYVVKRVGRVSRGVIELLSLNPAYPPLRVPRSARAVLGTVVLRWCGH
jgi:SOS-response transcriptional repressor LexA